MPSFAERYAPLHAALIDPDAHFSGSQMLNDLSALLPLAEALGEDSPELARLCADISLLQGKRGEDESRLLFGERGLAIHRRRPVFSPSEALALHYGVAMAAGELDETARAIDHLQQAIELAPNDPRLSSRQVHGLRQELGFWLHVAGRYADALAHNRELLADAESVYGADEAELTGMLTNLAQNAYELKDFSASEGYLQRCLALALQHGKQSVAFDMLFQLGVLAQERGDATGAGEYFQQRLALARKWDDEYYIERAKDDIAELERRLQG